MKRERAGEREREPAAEQKVHDIIYVIMGHYKQKLEAKQKNKKKKRKEKRKAKLAGGGEESTKETSTVTDQQGSTGQRHFYTVMPVYL